jgi:hypothetical protein
LVQGGMRRVTRTDGRSAPSRRDDGKVRVHRPFRREITSTRTASRRPRIVTLMGWPTEEAQSGSRIYNGIIGRSRSYGGQAPDRARP